MTTARCIYREEHDDTHLEIWEEGDHRSLWFDDVILQTEIHLQDPAVLPNPVNRAMLAHLMFDAVIERVMLAGCGGGAIARWLHARAPEVAGDAVELSPTVARLAREYFDFPPPESNWRLLIEDVRDHLVHTEASYDFILIDLEENQVTPAWVTDAGFLARCRDHLGPDGILVINLILGDTAEISRALLRVRQAFGSDTLLLDEVDHDNLLVFAFRSALPAMPTGEELRQRGQRWGIDFAGLVRRITHVAANASAHDAG